MSQAPNQVYSEVVMGASPGVYVFKRNGRVAYVGRSDSDVAARESKSFNQANYDLMTTIYETQSAREAYRKECRLFHRHGPIDNQVHPRVPVGTNWRCPVKGCLWS
jgi:excinuclease UvrABC nuclease subunit